MRFKLPTKDLGEIVFHQKGFAFKSKDYQDSGVPVVRVTNFTADSIDDSELKYVSRSIAQINNKFMLKNFDVVIATVGSWPKNPASIVGKVIQVPENLDGALLNQNSVILRVKDLDLEDQQYLYIALKSKRFSEYIVSTAQGSANQASITLSDIFNYEIEWPSKIYRNWIVKVIGNIDKKIAINRKTNETLKQIAQALFKSWFVDFDPVKAKVAGLQPAGMDEATAAAFPDSFVESQLGLIPKGWNVRKLSDVIQLTGGGTPKRSMQNYWNGEIPWFSVKDTPSESDVFVINTDEKISLEGLNNSSTKLLNIGTTIITARGTVGKLAMVGSEMAMNQSCYGVTPVKPLGDFFNYFQLKNMLQALQQNTHGAIFDTITSKTFESVHCVIPSSNIAQAFEAIVKKLMGTTLSNSKMIASLTEIRNTLLTKLLSGEITITGDNVQEDS
ncbi:restriction endonuclease subunit S [Paenibacillus sp. FA6]|uniref:restriction endonuclease subunit S n=1 Tax=Paenibacillus sp. FA6 TaxID=3413029 RepID=UPI003F65E9DC